MDKHWNYIDFSILKVNFKNAFNLVSRGAVLQKCTKHFPDLLPWVALCYGSHPFCVTYGPANITIRCATGRTNVKLYCSGDISSFPPELKVSHLPHFRY